MGNCARLAVGGRRGDSAAVLFLWRATKRDRDTRLAAPIAGANPMSARRRVRRGPKIIAEMVTRVLIGATRRPVRSASLLSPLNNGIFRANRLRLGDPRVHGLSDCRDVTATETDDLGGHFAIPSRMVTMLFTPGLERREGYTDLNVRKRTVRHAADGCCFAWGAVTIKLFGIAHG